MEAEVEEYRNFLLFDRSCASRKKCGENSCEYWFRRIYFCVSVFCAVRGGVVLWSGPSRCKGEIRE